MFMVKAKHRKEISKLWVQHFVLDLVKKHFKRGKKLNFNKKKGPISKYIII